MKLICLRLLAAVALAASATAQEPSKNEPKELTDLRGSWTRARTQATEPIDRKYVEALNTLKLRFTKAGQLAEALAIETELNSLKQPSTGTQDSESEPDLGASTDLSWLVGKSFVYRNYVWNIEPDQKVLRLQGEKTIGRYPYTIESDGRIKIMGDLFEIKSRTRAILFKTADDKEGYEIQIETTK